LVVDPASHAKPAKTGLSLINPQFADNGCGVLRTHPLDSNKYPKG
jgi:hypothetical protein